MRVLRGSLRKLRSLSGRAGCGSVYFRVIDLCNSGRNAAGMPPAANGSPIGISASLSPSPFDCAGRHARNQILLRKKPTSMIGRNEMHATAPTRA